MSQIPFREALKAAVDVRELLVLSTVPLLLLGTFALPVETRISLRFVYREPTLLTAYTSHFVHFETAHLLANLFGYLLLAGGGYALAALAGYRRLFGAAVATFLVAFPPVLSALNLAVPRHAVGYGFSGLNMAFAGLLGVVLVGYGGRIDDRIRLRHAPGVFFLGVTVVAVVALPPGTTTLALGVTSASFATIYAVSVGRTTLPRNGRRLSDAPPGWLDAGALGSVAFVGYQVVGYPTPAVDGRVVNLYVHLLGFCLGFIVPYVALATGLVSGDQGFLSD